jgi:coenzyme F420 hydrogenase subunit beta
MTAERSATVARVVDSQLCTGCGLCASLSRGAIVMQSVAPGYNRPIQEDGIDAGVEATIAAACPGAVVEPWPQAGMTHPAWGPYRSVSTGFATDAAVRFRGSSGGAVTALALAALRSGLVDRVVHVVADTADPAGNRVTVSRSTTDVIEGAGSRYVSSSLLRDIDQLLSEGGAMAFIGKPCDVSALRRLARIDPRVDAHIPLMLAFFCAGIPSRNAVGRVLGAMAVEDDHLRTFRYRGNGWPGKAVATAKDGRVAEMSYEDSWGGYLSKEVQFRCKICPDAVGGVADIACADAWYGGETGYPTFEEMDGRSLILTRTTTGEALVRSAMAAGVLSTEPLAVAEIDLMQPSQAARKRLILARTAALAVLLRPRPVMTGLKVIEAGRGAGLAEQLRNFLGTIRRALQGRLSQR